MEKIAIIGAGGAGLSAGRHCLDLKLSIDIFEQTGNVGGTWNYTECVGVDQYGVTVHSSMYQNLRTNLPKEVMAFENFPYPELNRSYINQEEVIKYLQNFSDKFQITKHIKFWNRVTRVVPQQNEWLIEYEDVRTKEKSVGYYTAVMVCNGHNFLGFVPEIKGIQYFQNHFQHSHDYRRPDPYQNKRVLVIGAGPSGSDISQQIAKIANKVFVSFKSPSFSTLPIEIQQKCVVKELQPDKRVIFEDESIEEVDEILFCTGYKFNFPFLAKECLIEVEKCCVQPLHQHIINIEYPTMGFIGLPVKVCPFPLFDIQVRFFLSTITQHYKLPPKSVLMNKFAKLMAENECPSTHELGVNQGAYFVELAKEANIKCVPPVIHDLYMRVRRKRDLTDCFKIIDEDNWEQIR